MSDIIHNTFGKKQRSKAVTMVIQVIGFEKWQKTPVRKKDAKVFGQLKKMHRTERNEVKEINRHFISQFAWQTIFWRKRAVLLPFFVC